MKNRYQRLSGAEKKEAKKRYAAFSERNKNYLGTLNRMFILGIIGLIYGLLSTIFDVFVLSVPVYSYVIDGVIIIFSVFLIVQKLRIESSTVNKFLIEENKGKDVVKEVKKDETKKVEVKEEPKKIEEKIVEPVKEEVKKVEVEIPKVKEEKKEVKKTTTKKETKDTDIEKPKKRKHVSKNVKAKKKTKKK